MQRKRRQRILRKIGRLGNVVAKFHPFFDGITTEEQLVDVANNCFEFGLNDGQRRDYAAINFSCKTKYSGWIVNLWIMSTSILYLMITS